MYYVVSNSFREAQEFIKINNLKDIVIITRESDCKNLDGYYTTVKGSNITENYIEAESTLALNTTFLYNEEFIKQTKE